MASLSHSNPKLAHASESQLEGSKVAQKVIFYENLATSSNLQVEPSYGAPRRVNAQPPLESHVKAVQLESVQWDDLNETGEENKTTAMENPSVTDLSQPSAQHPSAQAQIEAPLDPGLYEPSQGAFVPYNPGESPAEGP